MFDRNYKFYGSHAKKAVALNTNVGKTGKGLFDRLLDVYLTAPLVGFLFGTKAELNKDDGEERNIFLEQISQEKNKLELNYRTIMLLDEEYESDLDKRVDKVFRTASDNRDPSDEEHYESYVRGGVDKLYEKLIEPAKTPDDYYLLLVNFLEEFDTRYNKNIDALE